MKRLFILGIVMIILISSIPTYAEEVYNDGPLPNNPHYMHLTINTTNYKGVVVENDLWLYGSLDNNTIIADIDYHSGTNEVRLIQLETKAKSYRNGSTATDYVRVVYRSPSSSEAGVSGHNLTLPELMDIINDLKYFKVKEWNEPYQVDKTFEYIVHFNTLNIVDRATGETIVYPMAPPLPEYEDEGFIRILSPVNNFKQSGGLPYWAITVYYNVPVSESQSIMDWSISPISDTIKGVKVNSHEVKKIGVYPYEFYSGTMSATYSVPIGEHDLAFKMQNKLTGKTYLSSVYQYTNLSGFEDSDGDGIDDRTGLPDTGYIDDGWLDDGTNNGYLPIEEWSMTTLFSNIGALLNNFKVSVSSLLTQITDMSSIFSVLTSVIPSEIVALLSASILLFVILKVFHR